MNSKRMTSIKLALAIVFAGLGAQALADTVEVPPASIVVEQQLSAADAPTPLVDVAIVTPDAVCYTGLHGTDFAAMRARATGVPRFHVASVAKVFTGTVLMQLVEEGKLSLDDPVAKYVPEFKGSPITIAQLFTHTSGLRDRQGLSHRASEDEVRHYIDKLARQYAKPGKWSYADAGFNLLGRVIEHITGKPYAVVLRERVFLPLGMRDSAFDVSEVPVADRVPGYRGTRRLDHPWDRAFAPSSGLQTTALDLSKFAQAVLRVNAGREVPGLMRRESLLAMTRPRLPTEWEGVDQGYAWQLATTPRGIAWRHAGGEEGFESLLAIYPTHGFAVVVLGDREGWPRFPLEAALADAVVQGRAGCAAAD